jgi:ribosomal protein S30
MYEDGKGCSETSAYKIQTPKIHTKERIKYLSKRQELQRHFPAELNPP